MLIAPSGDMGRNTESGTMSKADATDLFPKTATDLLVDIIRHTEGRMSKNEITQRWQGHSWSSATMRQWAAWVWKENVR